MTPAPRTRAIGAVLALAAVAAAVPWGLARISIARFGGAAPWTGIEPPQTWRIDRVSELLSRPLTDALLVDVLIRLSLAVVWAATVVLLATVAAEVVHRVRHDGIGLPSVRGLGWGQPLARYIATGLLVIGPMLGGSRATAHAPLPERTVAVAAVTSAESDVDHPVRPPTTEPAPAAAVGTYSVAPGDSIYAIAERLAGGDRTATVVIADRILDLNLGTVMPDGQRFTNAAYIEVGWVLELPAEASEIAHRLRPDGPADDRSRGDHHVVVTGDSLSAIAGRVLGDQSRWPEIWDANAGREMVDGRTFDDPDLILPGWELEMPVETAPPSPDTGTTPDLDPEPDSDIAPSGEPPPSPEDDTAGEVESDPDADPIVGPEVGGQHDDGNESDDEQTPPSTRAGPAGVDEQVAPSTTERMDRPDVLEVPAASSPGLLGLGQAAMLSAGVLGLVVARRSRTLRAAGARARLPEPRPAEVAVERVLRTVDVGERPVRLDLALRAVAAEVADRDRQVLVAFVLADGSVEVVLTGPCELGAPWVGAGHRWELPAAVLLEDLARAARRSGPPCSALVHLGRTVSHPREDGDRTGPFGSGSGQDIVAGAEVFVDLEAVGLLAVDAPPEYADAILAAIGVGLLTSPLTETARLVTTGVDVGGLDATRSTETADTAAEALALARELVGNVDELTESTFALRSRRRGGEAWEPAVVLIGSTAAAGAAERVDRLPSVAHRGLATVIATHRSEAGAQLSVDGGGWRLELSAGPPDDDCRCIALVPVGLDSSDLRSLADLIELAGTVDEPTDAGPPAPATGVDGSRPDGPLIVFPTDSTDSSGPIWEPPEWSLMVRLLGPVDVVDTTGTAAVFEKSKACELIAWAAMHRERSTRTGARTALWELDVRDATFSNVVSAARRTMARLVTPPDGQEWLGRTQTERLPLHERVVTDAELLAARVAAARERCPAEAIAVLEPGVASVRGAPFEGTSYLWPDPEGITSNLVLLATNAAAQLAELHLSVGDVEGVFRATSRGLLVLPGHEELIALRMRAHGQVGDHAGVRQEWESYERVVTSDPWGDGELAPKLVELRRELLSSR